MRVAIVHYWLLNMRGGEKVVESLCRMFPEADLFTLFYNESRVSPLIRSRRVTASFLNSFRRHYRLLLPLMPMALENLDLRGYDLILSSESGPAKGIIAHAATRHVCYCHTPMRYLWDLYPDYVHDWTPGGLRRAFLTMFGTPLRVWDFSTAARVDHFVANSRNVQRRIERVYRRDSTVVHPPVAIENFYWRPPEDYYLVVSELVAYKRVEHSVAACVASGRKLKIVGDGPEYKSLRRMASGSVEFCGRLSDADLRECYARCRAFVQPGEEDFGIASVEALASGKAVVALGRGGILEIARDGETGFFYDQPQVSGLLSALQRFEAAEASLRHEDISATAAAFAESVFQEKMRAVLQNYGAVWATTVVG